MGGTLTYTDIVKILREYGPVEGDFVASQLGMTMTDTRPYLDELQNAGIIEKRGEAVMLKGETRTSSVIRND